MTLLSVLDILLMIVGGAGMIYQGLCIVMSLFAKPVRFPDAPMTNRYAVLISARNEEKVIGNLIGSIRDQTYPSNLIDIWLVADNCTDNTADVVRSLGCHVVERHNLELVGKGYALTYLLGHMLDIGVADDYEAYFVFDADNKLDKHYFEEMNKAFCSGFKILTSYRNSVNLADNWVSSGSALWFIRESRFLSNSRMILGSSCHVGGTGFMFSREVMKRTRDGSSICSLKILNSLWIRFCMATASAIAVLRSSTTSSRLPSRKVGVSVCVGARDSCRYSVIMARHC